MARTKAQPGQEAKADEAANGSSAENVQADTGQSGEPADAGDAVTGADAASSASTDDGAALPNSSESGTGSGEREAPGGGEPPDSEGTMRVLILRDENIAGIDYRPGETPTLPARLADGLIARGAADASAASVTVWRQNALNEKQVVE